MCLSFMVLVSNNKLPLQTDFDPRCQTLGKKKRLKPYNSVQINDYYFWQIRKGAIKNDSSKTLKI